MTERLTELMDHEAQDLYVPGAPAREVLSRGRGIRRRRRVGSTAAALVGVAAVAGLGFSVTGGGTATEHRGVEPAAVPVPVPTAVPTANTALLDACRAGNQPTSHTDAIFGSGTPVVKAVVRTDFQAKLAIESADGTHWADCFVYPAGADMEFAAGMTVHSATGTDTGLSYSSGAGCHLTDGEPDPGCETFQASWVDRRPSEVAAAVVETADGRSTTVPSKDGYFVLNHVGVLPAGVDGSSIDFQPFRRITFLDAEGTPIAAQAMDGSGTGEDREKVDGLPTLEEFPTQGVVLDS